MQKSYIEIINLKTGKINFQPMHSFTTQFLACLHQHFGFDYVFRARCIDNSQFYSGLLKNANGINGDLKLGLVVGSGSTPGNTSNYCLETPLEITAESTAFTNPDDLDGYNYITVERYFENTGEANINVREIGLYCYGQSETLPILVARDVLDANDVFEPDDRKLIKLHLGFEDYFTTNWLHFLLYRLEGCNGDLQNPAGNWEDTNGQLFKLNAPSGSKSYGIVIGTGNTPHSINDYCLDSQVSTDWIYGAVLLNSLEKAGDGSKTTMQIKRDFTNQTGSSVTIKEVGIIATFDGNASYEKALIARYVITPQIVANGQTLTIKWNFVTPIATYIPEEEPPE